MRTVTLLAVLLMASVAQAGQCTSYRDGCKRLPAALSTLPLSPIPERHPVLQLLKGHREHRQAIKPHVRKHRPLRRIAKRFRNRCR